MTLDQFFLGLGLFLMLMGFGIIILYRAHSTLKKQLNGRLTELLVVTKALARANGIAEGRAQQIEEENDQKKHHGNA